MVNWVYAAVAVWVFERLVRLVLHVSSVVNSRFIARKPLIEARASLVEGAIKLTVPFPGGNWIAGQHAYLTFWSVRLIKLSHPARSLNEGFRSLQGNATPSIALVLWTTASVLDLECPEPCRRRCARAPLRSPRPQGDHEGDRSSRREQMQGDRKRRGLDHGRP